MKNKDVFIADGHHRYETAVNYTAEIENSNAPESLKNNSKYALAYFCKLDDRSLTILPTHRLVKDIGRLNKNVILEKLRKFFIIKKYNSAGNLISALKELRNCHMFGMYMGGKKFYCLMLENEEIAHNSMGRGHPTGRVWMWRYCTCL